MSEPFNNPDHLKANASHGRIPEPLESDVGMPVKVTVRSKGSVYNGMTGEALCKRDFGGHFDYLVMLDGAAGAVRLGFQRSELAGRLL